MQAVRCRNAKGGRPSAPTCICPICRQVLNDDILGVVCSKGEHAEHPCNRNIYSRIQKGTNDFVP